MKFQSSACRRCLMEVVAVAVAMLGTFLSATESDGEGEDLITRSYWLSRGLFETCSPLFTFLVDGELNVDAKRGLKSWGITFGAGSDAVLVMLQNRVGKYELLVRNTKEQHELVEQFVASLAGPPFEYQVATIVEVIELDRAGYQRWQYENSLVDTGDRLRHFVQQKVRSGDAKVIETLGVTARSGQPATTTSYHFEVYPSKDNPSLTPEKVMLHGARARSPEVIAGATAWECRDVGERLRVDPVIRENYNDVDLNLGLTITGYDKAEHSVWPNEEIPDHERRERPIFDTRKVHTQVTVTHGGYALLAVWKPTDEDAARDKVHLVFVRADIMALPVP